MGDVTFLSMPARFHCLACGPTNRVMGITDPEGHETLFCVVCRPDLAQQAARLKHTSAPRQEPPTPQVA